MSYRLSAKGWMDKQTKLYGTGWMGSELKNNFIAACGEYVGTVLFLWFAFVGTQVANIQPPSDPSAPTPATGSPNPAALLYIALSFGFSLAVNAWVFYRVSGGLFNPAVTLAMVLAGAMPPLRAVFVTISQILGGITAAALVQAMLPGALLVNTTLQPGCSLTRGLFIEMFLTAQLVFTIFMLANEKTKATFLAPVGIGLSLFIAELAGVWWTGGSLNPARSFGPAVVNLQFPGYHWIYWVGPGLGSVVATGFYKFIKILEYENANPEQDLDLTTSTAIEEQNRHYHLRHHRRSGEMAHSTRFGSEAQSGKDLDLEAGLNGRERSRSRPVSSRR